MPRPAKKSTKQETPKESPHGRYWLPADAPWGGFINIRLQEDDKVAFAAWREMDASGYWRTFDDLMGDGMKIGMAYDAENECYVCTFTGRLLASVAERFCTTTRASTWDESVALAVWKHGRCENGWYDGFRPKTGRMDNWG